MPFTQQILKQEVEGVTFTTLMHTSHRDLLSMFDMLKKQRMAVQDAKNKGALPPRSLCPLPTTLLTGRRSFHVRQPHKQDGAR